MLPTQIIMLKAKQFVKQQCCTHIILIFSANTHGQSSALKRIWGDSKFLCSVALPPSTLFSCVSCHNLSKKKKQSMPNMYPTKKKIFFLITHLCENIGEHQKYLPSSYRQQHDS